MMRIEFFVPGAPVGSTSQFAICGDLLIITTSKGARVIADASDFDKLKDYSWCISKTGYAVARIDGKVLKLHRFLLGECKGVIDHMNGNPLDNRRRNLRKTTQKENARNIGAQKNTRSGKVGVSKVHGRENWRARIMVDGREICLGHFDVFADAVLARRAAETQYFGFQLRG